METQHYLTPDEAAQILRVTPRTIYTWLRAKTLKGRKMGKGATSPWRIPVGAVVERKEEK